MNIWVVGTSNQLHKTGSYYETRFLKASDMAVLYGNNQFLYLVLSTKNGTPVF